MASSKLLDPLSDHLSRLLIAHRERQTCGGQFSKSSLLWHLSVLQKQLQNRAQDRSYRPLSSYELESTCEDQDLEFSGEEETLTMEDVYSSYSSDEFRMFEFKVRRCTRGRSHDWTECPFAHPGEKARRRDPRRFHYSGTACADFRKGTCKRGDGCEFAHGVFECWLHPARYRTQPCKDGVGCRRRVCFFAHTPQELRVVSSGDPQSQGSSHGASRWLLCNWEDHCTVCTAATFQTPSPVSTLMGFPESPPSLSPPLSPSSPFPVPELSLASKQIKLARHLSIPSGDQMPSLCSFFSAPSSPSDGSFLQSPRSSLKLMAMADLAHSPQQQRPHSHAQGFLQAQSFCSPSSPLRNATSTSPCACSMPADEEPIHIWRKCVDQKEMSEKTEENGGFQLSAGGDGGSRSRLCEKAMAPFKRGDSFPDLQWVDELVGYD